MIVVDSSVWIANLRGEDRPAVAYLNGARPSSIIVGDIVMLEVLRGALDEQHAQGIERRLRRFRVEPMLGANIAALAARHYRLLRGVGITMRKGPDLVIATYCIARRYALLHDDRDFDPLVDWLGLRVVETRARP